MKIEVHDVDHGGCVVITTPNNKRIMLDCGVNHDRPWYPSVEFHGERIDLMFLMNLDEDHVEDLPYILDSSPLGSVFSNPTIPASTLAWIKSKGMKGGVQKAHDMLARFGPGMMGQPPADLGGVAITWFCNRYGLPHTDTNNLSLAVFIEYGPFSILFSGDLETAGWRSLQATPSFNECLHRVKVYVASHHGRENGQCEEIFNYCTPEVILLSDGPKQYVSQETNSWYRTRATGIPEMDKPAGLLGRPRRYVMTTRRDGTMKIDVSADGRFLVNSERAISNALAAAALGAPSHIPTRNAFAGLGAFEQILAPNYLAPGSPLDDALLRSSPSNGLAALAALSAPPPAPALPMRNAFAGLGALEQVLTPDYLAPRSALDNALLRSTPTNGLSALAALGRR